MTATLSRAAGLAWQIGAAEAAESQYPRIEPAHLLVGICSLEKIAAMPPGAAGLERGAREAAAREEVLVRRVFARVQVDPTMVRRALRRRVGRGAHPYTQGVLSRSEACKDAFGRAAVLAGEDSVNCGHLLAALWDAADGVVADVSHQLRIRPSEVRAHALALAGELGEAPLPVEPAPPGPPAPPGGGTPTLDAFGRDLTALAARGALPPVVGRRIELLALLQTLARETKSNPVLVGEAGVGKTAIVEALAQRLHEGRDGVLAGCRIVELSLGALLGGTRYRGELEERVGALLAETRAHPEVIVFIDELHLLAGAGRVEGVGAADLLKPALARGDLRCIGATTPEEFPRLEKDAALERRFQKILVGEPSRAEALEMLRARVPAWERHHGVRVGEEALAAAVDLSARFDAEHHLPDKAFDLVDEAAARARVPVLSMRSPSDAASAPEPSPAVVDAALVARTLAERRGLPLELVAEGLTGLHRPRVLELEAFLRARIFGQDEAIAAVAQRLRLAYGNLTPRRGPLAVFLFLGPTGVGKTETARLLADFLLGGAAALVRLDMSEYREEHNASRLVGAPPGYVGHGDEGQLTGALRQRPHALVLLDEVEKAHPRVLDVFLQLFDEGRLTDGQGRTADGRQAVFVMTSNLAEGGRERVGFAGPPGEPPAGTAAGPLEMARRFFRPELLARVDEIVAFRPLGEADALRVLRRRLEELRDALRERHQVSLTVAPETEAFLLREGFAAPHGVRDLHRAVERHLQAPLSALILSGKLTRHPSWTAVYDEGGVYLLPA